MASEPPFQVVTLSLTAEHVFRPRLVCEGLGWPILPHRSAVEAIVIPVLQMRK